MSAGGPSRCCDLVLKGGLTSGVLYPAAIQEIAQRFSLVGIGGTSAGAIAACAAAAAEYRRRHGSGQGYEELGAVSRQLAGEGRLLSLLRPDRRTRRSYRTLLRLLRGEAGMFTYLGLFLRRNRILGELINNGYGLCSGMAHGDPRPGAPPLTAWLADMVDEIAGKTDGPLCFGDLHDAPPAASAPRAGRAIDLRAVTTCLSFQRPFELPFASDIFAFDPEEFARLFPARIVEHMVRAGSRIDSELRHRDGKLPLPAAELPVVVAARMSLSFPGLISMVPLWTTNFRAPHRPLQRVWFSDGGITSNFPIHRFDSLYPRWPTLGINLRYTDDSGLPQRNRARATGEMVYLPERPGDGTLDLWNAFDAPAPAVSGFMKFALSIFSSAQNWHDEAFMKLPAYRDRVAEIWLSPEEGGLNLDMPAATIEALIARGREAGQRLAQRFAELPDDDPMSWQAHRWTRFRSSMAGLNRSLETFARAAEPGTESGAALSQMLDERGAPPTLNFRSVGKAATARRATRLLLDLAAALHQLPAADPADPETGAFGEGPRPGIEIGTRAPL